MSYNFKGHDYAELASALGVALSEDEADDEDHGPLTNKLLAAIRFGEPDPKVVSLARAFVESLIPPSSRVGYKAPLWRGLLAIEDDFTFLKMLAALIPYAWT